MFASIKEEVEDEQYETGEDDGLQDNQAAVGDFSVWEDIVSQDIDKALLGLEERIRFFAHSVQLEARNGLQKIASVRQAIAKCLRLASIPFLHPSFLFCSTFHELFVQRPSTEDMRWNSIYNCKKMDVRHIHHRAIWIM